MDFHYYPNDKQTCDIKFESFGYTTEYLKFEWDQMIDYVSDELTMKQFKMTAILQPPYVTDTYDLQYPGFLLNVRCYHQALFTEIKTSLIIIQLYFV